MLQKVLKMEFQSKTGCEMVLNDFVRSAHRFRPNQIKTNKFFSCAGEPKTKNRLSVAEILRRPSVRLNELIRSSLVSVDLQSFSKEQRLDFLDEAETLIKYEGYIARQNTLIQRLSKNEETQIPNNFRYNQCSALSKEAREKLSLVRPQTLGQASRISGVSPADVAALSVFIFSG